MVTSTLIPLDVYLATDYRPDCDWIDGEVKERNVGEGQHSSVQKFFVGFFSSAKKTGKFVFGPSSACRLPRIGFEFLM